MLDITWSAVPERDLEFASTSDGGAIAVYAQKSGGWGWKLVRTDPVTGPVTRNSFYTYDSAEQAKVGVIAAYEGHLAFLAFLAKEG